MAKFLIFFVVLGLSSFSDGAKIVEIQTRTGDDLYAGMGVNGKISLDICAIVNVAFGSPEISCCQVIPAAVS